jgi:hypothetical protein
VQAAGCAVRQELRKGLGRKSPVLVATSGIVANGKSERQQIGAEKERLLIAREG